MALMYYFMHEDDDGDGQHLIQWMHAWRAALITGNADKYQELIKKHLYRDRTDEELEEDIRSALVKKGVRVDFSGHRRIGR